MRSKDFGEIVLPVLVEKWSERCFCRNPGFLKLLSFDFADYRAPAVSAPFRTRPIAPVELLDSELVWSATVGERFRPLGDWTRIAGQEERVFGCPQCGSQFRARSEQYGINMWPTTTHPCDDRQLSDIGLYLVGFHFYVGEFDPGWVTDFSVAQSLDQFIECIAAAT